MFCDFLICTWNVNGWTRNNCCIRNAVISCIKPDIICLNETHLSNNHDNQPNVEGYSWIGHCRPVRHTRSVRQFGGVGILYKDSLLQNFDISVISKCYDGILGVLFTSKITGVQLLIICVYLPPEESPWGRDAETFFAHLLSIVYLYTNVDHVFIAGDLNARIGCSLDYMKDVDDLGDRTVLDHSINKHGESLLEFLIESKMMVLNGRVTPEFDNFTSVSTRGRAVVDYFITSHNSYSICSKLEVFLASDMIERYGLVNMLGNHCKMPDHSMITCAIQLATPARSDNIEVSSVTNDVPTWKFYYFDKIPGDFMNNNLFKQTLFIITERIQNIEKNEQMLDQVYQDFCKAVLSEMDEWLQSKDCSKQVRKRLKNSKPYWNEHLYELWRDMKDSEKQFLKFKGQNSQRSILREKFHDKRLVFDKSLRKAERTYYRNLGENLEAEININDPKAFWNHIQKLGPRKKSEIPLKIFDENGTPKCDVNDVLNHWRNQFSNLLNKPEENGENQGVKTGILQQLNIKEGEMMMANFSQHDRLNKSITREEIQKAVNNLKKGKAVGPDLLPNEILIHANVQTFVLNLIQFCFDNSIVPTMWKKAIINPIPKSASKDPCIPLNYRGISLLCCFSKLYSAIIHNRLYNEAEKENWIVEEQNGFRKKRSCLDHLFVITSVVRNNLEAEKAIFAAFVDFQKAFDWVDRGLLLYKLVQFFGINGKMYWAIKSMLQNSQSRIRLNKSFFSNWFDVSSGVRQGDSLSPLLFNLYINDLATEIKNLRCGVPISNDHDLSILLYADDIVLLSESEQGLQNMLNRLYEWCNNWCLDVNLSKTNVIHFRGHDKLRTSTIFNFGDHPISIVNEYKYLGLFLNENMEFNRTAQHLAVAGARALGAIRNKIYSLKDVGFKTFSKLFYSGVVPILDYCSSVWGFKKIKCIDDIQNRAVRYFLGVHRFCPLPMLEGDMGWDTSLTRRHISMVKLWNRIIAMSGNRLPSLILKYNNDHSNRFKNWFSEFKDLIGLTTFQCNVVEFTSISVDALRKSLKDKQTHDWHNARYQKTKLRYYNLFKHDGETEPYILSNLTKFERSTYAQFRAGILPLAIETGRFQNIELNDRLCVFCLGEHPDSRNIEDEFHFLCECHKYDELRKCLFTKISNKFPEFVNMDNIDKFLLLNTHAQIDTAKFVNKAYITRRNLIYK